MIGVCILNQIPDLIDLTCNKTTAAVETDANHS